IAFGAKFELAPCGGTHDLAQWVDVIGPDAEECFDPAARRRHLAIGIEALEWCRRPWLDVACLGVSAGVKVDTGKPEVTTLSQLYANATGAMTIRYSLSQIRSLGMCQPGRWIVSLGTTTW